MLIVAINGIGKAGKDTFVKCVQTVSLKDGKEVHVISPVDPIKKMYEGLGWDGSKTPQHRENLNTLKHIWEYASNGPVEWVKKEIREHDKLGTDILFVMVREFQEMMRLKNISDDMGHRFITLNVTRDNIPPISPIEESFLASIPKDFAWDYVIFNKYVDTYPDVPILMELAKSFWKAEKKPKLVTELNLYEQVAMIAGKLECNHITNFTAHDKVFLRTLCSVIEHKLKER